MQLVAGKRAAVAGSTEHRVTNARISVPVSQRAQRSSRQHSIRPCASSMLALEQALLNTAPATPTLATYQLRSKPSSNQPCWSQMWFEAMVQTVVKQLDGSPFLLRVRTCPSLQLNLIRLDSSELTHGWGHVQQQHLAAGADDAIILVHPVASEQQPCVVSQVQGQACPNCPRTQLGGNRLSSYDQTEMMKGRLGDCCAGEQQPASSSSRAAASHTHHHSDQRGHSSSSDSQLAYYGLVVQSRDAADPLQGCYLLKTMQVKQHSGGGSGCHCTHYSLNRICKGPSLQQQFQAAWLV